MFRIWGIAALVLMLSLTLVSVYAKSENSGQGSENSNKNTQVAQKSENSNKEQGSQNGQGNQVGKLKVGQGEASGSAKPVGTCAPEAQWKNHGEYVSCVAKLHQGGQAVSEAARSSIGKKSATASASLQPSPISTSSASPVASESALPSPTEEATPSGGLTETIQDTAQGLIISIQSLLSKLQSLFSF